MSGSVCSWSGGKDSALALDLAIQAGAKPQALFTMLDESNQRTRSHGLPLAVVEAQAAALGLPLFTRSASWKDYTNAFVEGLHELSRLGGTECIFGDIDTLEHRRWCEEVCGKVGFASRLPLWQTDRRQVALTLLDRGWTARIVVVRTTLLDGSYLGRIFDRHIVEEFEARGIDSCGENGEFHTVVTNGPLFAAPIEIQQRGEYAVGDCLASRLAIAD